VMLDFLEFVQEHHEPATTLCRSSRYAERQKRLDRRKALDQVERWAAKMSSSPDASATDKQVAEISRLIAQLIAEE
jgi:hypothetical protein